LCLALVAAAFFVLNVLTPLYADDYSYLYTFIYTDHKFRITNLSELFWSQLNHYKVMNGRTVAHTLAQVFLMWGKPLFNVINTAAFLALGWAMQALMTGERRFNLPLFGYGLVMLWFLTPSFGQDFLWLTGSCTYLYCVLLILVYLLPFRRALAGEDRAGALRAVLFFPFGVLAGWSTENAAAALIVMELCFLVALRLTGRPLRSWMFTGLAGSLAGFALLILAPGQSVRMTNSGGAGTLAKWLARGISITKKAGKYLWVPVLLLLAAALWRLWRDRGRNKASWRLWLPMLVLGLGTLASAYSMVVSPQFPDRAWSCIVIFAVVTSGSALARCGDLALPRPVKAAVCGLVLVCAAVVYGQACSSLYATYSQMAQRSAIVAEVLAQGGAEATVEPIRGNSRYNCFQPDGDLNTDSSVWPNTAIAQYYGLDAIHSTEEENGNG
jgi:hypothetical protein